ncbi:MAG TPA: hypothetical protein VL400_16825 [Polyangiaceae bacterium]|nr:hypothetical protein [Polyangiaceae bacterium]
MNGAVLAVLAALALSTFAGRPLAGDLVVAAPPPPPPPPRPPEKASTPAPAPAPPPPRNDDFFECTFLPEAGCTASGFIELSPQGGITDSYVGSEPIFRGVAAIGFLVPIRHTRGQLHLGPELDLGFDLAESTTDWDIAGKIRARWFVLGSDFVVEGGTGFVAERFAFTGGTETGVRESIEWDMGFGYKGIAGPFGSAAILGDPTGQSGTLLRATVGVRLNLVAWAAIFAGPAMFGHW